MDFNIDKYKEAVLAVLPTEWSGWHETNGEKNNIDKVTKPDIGINWSNQKEWLKFVAILARVNTAILLTLIYFVIIAPVNLIARISRTDLIGRRIGPEKSFWQEPESKCDNLENCRRQF